MSQLKIGFAGRWDPLDKKSWGGTNYSMYRQLQQKGTVEIFQFPYPGWLKNYLIQFYKNPQKWLFNKNVAVEFLKPYAKYYSKQLEKELLKRKVDVLFAPAAPQLIAYLPSYLPIVFSTDATFTQLQGYYDSWQNNSKKSIRQGIEVDQLAFQKASHCMLASDWCKQSSITDYGVSREKISVVPWGANLDQLPSLHELDFERSSCNLLFLGVEWSRKGGDIALQAFRLLKQKRLEVSLHIVGCVPPVNVNEKGITVIPYLNKSNPADAAQLHKLLLNTDFLVLPTRAEAAGIVFCEAAAYGIPSFATNTGGVSTYIQEGVNGMLLSPNADGYAYADAILSVFANKTKMETMKQTSRKRYDEELNWDTWGNKFSQLINSL